MRYPATSLFVFLLFFSLVSPMRAESDRIIDQRLYQTVELHAVATPISDLLLDISAQTGVKLTADKYIRDRKVTIILSSNQPLQEVMAHLRRDLRCRLSHTEDKAGICSYRLWQDAKSRRYEEWLRESKAREKFEKRDEEERLARADRISVLKDSLNLSQEDLLKMTVDDPNLVADLIDPISRGMVQYITGLPPDTLSELIAEGSLSLTYESLPAEIRDYIYEILCSDLRPGEPIPKITGIGLGGEEFPADIMLGMSTSDGYLHGCILGISDKGRYPEGSISDLRSEGLVSEETEKQFLDKCRAERDAEECKRQDEISNAGPEPDDPELTEKITLNLKSLKNNLSDVLGVFADESGLNFIAEHFTGPSISIPQWLNEEVPVYKVIHAICKVYGCEWQKRGSYILVNDELWYDKVPCELPKWFIDKWMKALKEKRAEKGFTLDDLSEAASEITTLQAKTLRYFPELSKAGMIQLRTLGYNEFRFYHSLTSTQRKKAWGDGLTYKQLSKFQRSEFMKFVRSEDDVSDSVLLKYGMFVIRKNTNLVNSKNPNIIHLDFNFKTGPAGTNDDLVNITLMAFKE